VTASEYTPSRSSSYHTASECRGASPWTWNESADRSSIDLDSSDPEHPLKVLPGTSSANISFDDSEHSFRSPVSFHEQLESEIPPQLPPKNSRSLQEEIPSPIQQENKIYTIFESPTTSPSEIEDDAAGDGVKVSDDNNNVTEMTGLSYYYQNIITKQVLKTCL
jgi:hypothetical protein